MNYVFYFFGLSLLISGVGIISGSESDITIIMGAVSLSLGFYLIYVGGKKINKRLGDENIYGKVIGKT